MRIPSFSPTDRIAAHCDGCSGVWSKTIRTARSRTSGECLLGRPMGPILSLNGPSDQPGTIQREENRVLKTQLRNQRVRLTDDDRRRLAILGARLGRRLLADVATIVMPDTGLRWHRQLVAAELDVRATLPSRSVLTEIRRLVVADGRGESDLGLHVDSRCAEKRRASYWPFNDCADSETQGLPPVPERLTSWQTVRRAHQEAIVAADLSGMDSVGSGEATCPSWSVPAPSTNSQCPRPTVRAATESSCVGREGGCQRGGLRPKASRRSGRSPE